MQLGVPRPREQAQRLTDEVARAMFTEAYRRSQARLSRTDDELYSWDELSVE